MADFQQGVRNSPKRFWPILTWQWHQAVLADLSAAYLWCRSHVSPPPQRWSAAILSGCSVIKYAVLVLRGPKSTKKRYPPHFTPPSEAPVWINAFFFFIYANSDPKSRLIRPTNVFPIINCPILVSMYELQPHFPLLSWWEWHRCGLQLLLPVFFKVPRVECSEMILYLPWL